MPRGPWHCDGEIDLGYGGALRTAATVITCDPIFDWFAYGGVLKEDEDMLSVIPRDGLRQRLAVVLQNEQIPWPNTVRFKIGLDRDGFAPEMPIILDKNLNHISFTMENRTKDDHLTELRLSVHPSAAYEILQDGKKIELTDTGSWDYPLMAPLQIKAESSKIEIVLKGKY